jgi:hypothetical protein
MGSWTDPATLTDEQIEAELSEVELKLGELWARDGSLRQGNGGYGRSKRFVRGASDGIKLRNPRSDDGARTDQLAAKLISESGVRISSRRGRNRQPFSFARCPKSELNGIKKMKSRPTIRQKRF